MADVYALKKAHHKILILGGGTAGIAVAARLAKAKQADIAIVDPSAKHYYQPLWTLVGGGRAPLAKSVRDQAGMIPKGVKWIKDAAVEIDPDKRVVSTRDGMDISYDWLVVCPGIQLDWNQIPGVRDTLGKNGVSSNYEFALAPKTWEFIQNTKKGTALFTMPSGPIKCAGAPQKIAYLACDYWRKQGVLKDINVILAVPTPKIFGVPEFAAPLMEVVKRYGIDLRTESEVIEVNPDSREAVIINRAGGADDKYTVGYDMMHFVPPQSAPDWIKHSPLALKDAKGYVDIDKNTMRHNTWSNVFALGDAGSSPNSKTGAAIRKQAPVVVENLLAAMAGTPLGGEYLGYASCPLTTARNKMVLAEFDYTMKPAPSIPLINAQKERYDMWLLKRYGLPALYWNLMLKGKA
jgi:sulfide:quinone oxidoreductase